MMEVTLSQRTEKTADSAVDTEGVATTAAAVVADTGAVADSTTDTLVTDEGKSEIIADNQYMPCSDLFDFMHLHLW